MTYSFTTPAAARELVIENLKNPIASIFWAIVRQEGESFPLPCADFLDEDIEAITPFLNQAGWSVRRVPLNEPDRFPKGAWLFEPINEQVATENSPHLIFRTPTEARRYRLERLDAASNRIQQEISRACGSAFSLQASIIRAEEIESLKAALFDADWSVQRITHDGYGIDSWLFEPLNQEQTRRSPSIKVGFFDPT